MIWPGLTSIIPPPETFTVLRVTITFETPFRFALLPVTLRILGVLWVLVTDIGPAPRLT